MSETQVLDPPAAVTQDAKPAPDPQATASKDVAQPSARAGTDGQQQRTPGGPDATLQTAEKPSEETKPDSRTEEEIRREVREQVEREKQDEARAQQVREAAEKASRELKEAEQELRDARVAFAKGGRSIMDRIQEDADVVISHEVRQELEDHIENVNLKADKVAELKFKDEYEEKIRLAVAGSEQAFIDSMYGIVPRSELAAFNKKVEGKGYVAWALAAAEYATKGGGFVEASSFEGAAETAAKDANVQLNAAELTKLKTELKSAKTPEEIVLAALKVGRERGHRAPGGMPGSGGNGSGEQTGGGIHTMKQASRQYTQGLITRDEYRDYQARNQRGRLPD